MNGLTLISMILLPFFVIIGSKLFNDFDPFYYFRYIEFVSIPTIILWAYCLYFYYRYDRYSSAGIKLFFLTCLYAPFYYYNVIWKRKRELQNSYKSEEVLGNTIQLENYDADENKN
jgi:hypothetical protein